MSPWIRQHQFAFAAAVSTLRKAPGSFLFNVLVVAVALALPFAGITLLDNVRPTSEQEAARRLAQGRDRRREGKLVLANPRAHAAPPTRSVGTS